MKSLILDSMGVHEMNSLEMQSTDGGFVLVILAVCAVALTLPMACTTSANFIPYIPPLPSEESKSIDLAKRYNMPIGY